MADRDRGRVLDALDMDWGRGVLVKFPHCQEIFGVAKSHSHGSGHDETDWPQPPPRQADVLQDLKNS